MKEISQKIFWESFFEIFFWTFIFVHFQKVKIFYAKSLACEHNEKLCSHG